MHACPFLICFSFSLSLLASIIMCSNQAASFEYKLVIHESYIYIYTSMNLIYIIINTVKQQPNDLSNLVSKNHACLDQHTTTS